MDKKASQLGIIFVGNRLTYRKKLKSGLRDEARVAFLILLSQSSGNIVVTTIINDGVDSKNNQFLSLAIASGKIIISCGGSSSD